MHHSSFQDQHRYSEISVRTAELKLKLHTLTRRKINGVMLDQSDAPHYLDFCIRAEELQGGANPSE